MSDLSGKTALVTGASRGIGRASALALAKAGAQVVVHYGRGAKEAEAVVAEIHNIDGRADMIAADLAAPDGAHTLAKRVRGIVGDRLDILVLNAGVSKAATIEETTVHDFDHLFAVNVRAPFFLVQQLLPMNHDQSVHLSLGNQPSGHGGLSERRWSAQYPFIVLNDLRNSFLLGRAKLSAKLYLNRYAPKTLITNLWCDVMTLQ